MVALRGLAALRDRACACRDEGCNQEVERDFRDLADRYRNLVFDDDQREQVSTLASEMTVCLMNVVTGNLAASDDEIASTTVETCDAYVASIAALVRCDNVDDEERAKLRAGRDRLLGGLGDLSAARETERAQASDACLMALNAVRTGARGMGCAVE
ncbi:MAG: hypothetical protein H6708_02200 [Kofleriaceae bacterium]|nr:hypothetical protein [Myxococcales bacterium]MCB9559203.1 hypothetical protein [Kofleriaceae bacterium]